MFRVEIQLADENRLVETVEAMRTWLNDKEFVGYSLASARVMFRVDFANRAEAGAFATAFHGAIDFIRQ
jgi:negative regulator of replication initiation